MRNLSSMCRPSSPLRLCSDTVSLCTKPLDASSSLQDKYDGVGRWMRQLWVLWTLCVLEVVLWDTGECGTVRGTQGLGTSVRSITDTVAVPNPSGVPSITISWSTKRRGLFHYCVLPESSKASLTLHCQQRDKSERARQ